MAKKKAATKKRAPRKKPIYSLSLTLGDKTYTSNGDTPFDALGRMQPFKLSAKGVFVARKGNIRKSLVLGVPMLKKVFAGSNMSKLIFAKRVQTLVG